MRCHRDSVPVRTARGLILGALVLVISIAGHTAGADGSLPDLLSLLLLMPLAIAISITSTGRRRGVVWLLLYMLAVQALFHVLLVFTAGHAAHATLAIPSPGMLVLHIVATVVAACTLVIGDKHLASWLRFLDCLARDYRITAVELPWLAPVRVGTLEVQRLARATAHPVLRRGPPLPAS